MATAIAELFVSVSADVSGAIAGLNSLNTQLDKTSSAFSQAAPAALLFEAGAASVFTTIGAAINTAADFEQSMANVRAVMSPAEVVTFGDAISDLAIRLGRDTVFSASQAASGIEELIKAGIPAADVINGAADAAVNLAAATGIQIADAAGIAAQAMNAFGVQAQNMTATADVLTGVVNATAASMSDLRFGLQVVGPTAHSLGLDITSTAEAIGLLTNAGETGQIAGTGLRQMLLELTPTTKPAQEEMKKLGLVTADGKNQFFDATGKVKDFAQISQILQNALRGMSAEQRTAALNTLFTRDAINSAAILAGDGAAGFNKLKGAMAGITAEGVANDRLNTLRGTLTNLAGSVETAQILVGNTFIPGLRQLADAVNNGVQAFSKLDPSVRQGIISFALAAAGVLAAVGAFILFAPSIAAIGPALGTVGKILLTFSPLFAVAAAAVLGFKVAWDKNVGDIQTKSQAFSNIGDILQAAFSGDIGGAIQGFLEDIKTISPDVRSAFDNIGKTVGDFVRAIQPVLQIVGAALDQAFQGNFGGALDILQGLIGTFSPQLAGIVGIARQVAGALGDTLGNALQAVGKFLQDNGPRLGQLAQDLFPKIQATAEKLGPILGDAFSGIGTFLSEHGQQILDLAANIFPSLQSAAETLGPIIGNVFNGVGQFLADHGEDLKELATNTFNDLKTAAGNLAPVLSSAFDGVSKFLADHGEELKSFGANTFGTIKQAASDFKDFWDNDVSKTFEAIGKAADLVKPHLGDLAAEFHSIVDPPVVSFFSTLNDTLTKMATNASHGNPLGQFFSDLGTSLKTFGDQIGTLSPIFTAVANLFGALFNLIGTLVSIGAAGVQSLFQSLGDGMKVFLIGLSPFVSVIETVLTPFRLFIELLSSLSQNPQLIAAISGVIQFFADRLNDLATALQKVRDSGGANIFDKLAAAVGPTNQPGSAGAQNFKTAFIPGGAGAAGAGAVVVNFNAPISLNGTGDLADFAQAIANAIFGAAKRVAPPVDNSAHPALAANG